MDLSIITVPWNVKDLVRENFKAIFANTENIEFEVISVDNDSKDGTTEMIKAEFPQVTSIFNNYNAGFAKANNQGIKISRGRYVLLLNPDMRVLPGTLEKMVRWMDGHKDVGVAGCHLINEKGETVLHVRRFPTVWDQLFIILKLPHLFPNLLGKYLMRDFDYTKEAEADSIRGSFFMIRWEVIDKLGGLDERYFLWFEEVDYCRQAKNAGWKLMYTPAVKCIDHVGKSFGQVPRGRTQIYFRDSMLKYFKKWHPFWQYWVLKIAWPIGIFIALIVEEVRSKK
jgi:GT2 family glycosyltransferase